jgi:hypothetical protein
MTPVYKASQAGSLTTPRLSYSRLSGNPEYVGGYDFLVDFLVVAGGGSGAGYTGGDAGCGGGGAGGVRCSVDASGGATTPEPKEGVYLSVPYRLTIGAGGAAPNNTVGNPGNDSVFGGISSTRGGRGGRWGAVDIGGNGGSGGGSGAYPTPSGASPVNAGGTGTTRQGFDGGAGSPSPEATNNGAGGGGGAGAVGEIGKKNGGSSAGGNGISTSISGSSTSYGGGGGGTAAFSSPGRGLGGSGGGGNGGVGGSFTGSAGSANTGGGGGGLHGASGGYGGGSGVVIIRYPASYSATFSGGVTSATTTVGSVKISTITAAGTTDTVTWAVA